MEFGEIEFDSVSSFDDQDEVSVEIFRAKPVEISGEKSNSGILGNIQGFVDQLLKPDLFVVFNLICIFQTVPALYYYITFFHSGYFIKNTTGMTVVWGATIGSICSVIVTTAIGPLPPNVISRPFCICVIAWEYLIFFSLLVAAVCLGVLEDYNGMIWSIFGSISGLLSGSCLWWIGKNLNTLKLRVEAKMAKNNLFDIAPHFNTTLELTFPKDGDGEFVGINNNSRSRIDEEASAEAKGSGEDASSAPRVPSQEQGLEQEQKQKQGQGQGQNISSSEKPPTCLGRTTLYVIQFVLWLVLFVFCVVPAGFGVDQAIKTREHFLYPPPGTLISTPTAPTDHRSFHMHIHCDGATGQRPTVVLEADFGLSGYSLLNLQQRLVALDWRVCMYDRAGYGWSSMSPLASNSPVNVAFRLSHLLNVSGEVTRGNGFIFVGHGQGAELVQVMAALHPQIVKGIALVDGYSSTFRLQQASPKAINAALQVTCGPLQIGRALESLAVMRAVESYNTSAAVAAGKAFHPREFLPVYRSRLNNGRWYASQYSDTCMSVNAPIAATDWLTRAAGKQQQEQESPWPSITLDTALSSTLGTSVKWPSLSASGRSSKALVVSAGNTLSTGPLAATYRYQAQLYNATLTEAGLTKWIVCDDCDHNFLIESDEQCGWLAEEFNSFFS